VIHGEALVLRGQIISTLRSQAVGILDVYGYNDTGQKIVYAEGSDWVYENGGIRRTPESRIPDFAKYTVNASSTGKFTFVESPRNPPLIIGYDVYVDYLSPDAMEVIPSLNPGKSYQRVTCLGDSIAVGAHTISQFYFNSDANSYCGLLRGFLGKSAQVKEYSVIDGELSGVQPKLQQYISEHPQLVIIAFGMNDHVFQGATGLSAFRLLLDQTVAELQSAGIAVILVGFFQQNPDWVLEDPAQTVAYNEAIGDVALSHSVPFIDAYNAFNRVQPESELIERLTGDFMHHPNNYGQRIYFSLLLPYFLSNSVIASSVEDYVPGTYP